eukprot:8474484-Heterocapsa_arctica.AAC.1
MNVQSDDVTYAQAHFSLNDSNWLNPATGKYVCKMSLRELMKLRLVELEGEPTMTIRPWADNINNGRCTYCLKRGPRDICPVGATCRICDELSIRAQDEL